MLYSVFACGWHAVCLYTVKEKLECVFTCFSVVKFAEEFPVEFLQLKSSESFKLAIPIEHFKICLSEESDSAVECHAWLFTHKTLCCAFQCIPHNSNTKHILA